MPRVSQEFSRGASRRRWRTLPVYLLFGLIGVAIPVVTLCVVALMGYSLHVSTLDRVDLIQLNAEAAASHEVVGSWIPDPSSAGPEFEEGSYVISDPNLGCTDASRLYTWSEGPNSVWLERRQCMTQESALAFRDVQQRTPQTDAPWAQSTTRTWSATWAQGAGSYRLTTLDEESASALAQDLVDALPGQFPDEEPRDPASAMIVSLVSVWIVVYAPLRLWSAWRSRPGRPPSPEGAVVTDVTRRARGRRVLLALRPLAMVGLLFTLLSFAQEDFRFWWRDILFVLLFGGLTVFLTVVRRRIITKRPVSDPNMATRSLVGRAIVVAANAGLGIVLVVIGMFALGQFGRESVYPSYGYWVSDAWFDVGGIAANTRGALAFVITSVGVLGASAFLYCVLLPSIALYALWRFGVRLSAASVDSVRLADPRLPIVFLRNFAEDGRTMSAHASRGGLIGLLAPVRRRGVEELTVDRLWRYGPVIAIAKPGQRLPDIGAARVALSDDAWQDEVRGWCSDALVVVVSGAPPQPTEGFRWELNLLNEAIGHHRLMVVYPPQKRMAGVGVFQRLSHGLQAFVGAASPDTGDGTHVAVRASGRGWRRFGSRARTDIAFLTALEAALAELTPYWAAETHAERRALMVESGNHAVRSS